MGQMRKMYCWSCRYDFMADEKITRQSVCPKCLANLRCCRQCRHFSPGNFNDCDESEADYSGERDALNFCSWWSPAFSPIPLSGRRSGASRRDDAKNKWDNLFRD